MYPVQLGKEEELVSAAICLEKRTTQDKSKTTLPEQKIRLAPENIEPVVICPLSRFALENFKFSLAITKLVD